MGYQKVHIVGHHLGATGGMGSANCTFGTPNKLVLSGFGCSFLRIANPLIGPKKKLGSKTSGFCSCLFLNCIKCILEFMQVLIAHFPKFHGLVNPYSLDHSYLNWSLSPGSSSSSTATSVIGSLIPADW